MHLILKYRVLIIVQNLSMLAVH